MAFSRGRLGLAAKSLFYFSLNRHRSAPIRPTGKISNRKKKPKLDWFGGLKEYRDQYTAVELQKKTLDWRD